MRVPPEIATARKNSEMEQLRYRQQLEQEVGKSNKQLINLATELLCVEGRERRSLASDLHDELGQQLAVLKLKLSAMEVPEEIDTVQYPKVRDNLIKSLEKINTVVDRAVASVRSISSQISPPILNQDGLVAAMYWMAEDLFQTFGLRVHMDLEGMLPMSGVFEGAIYRTVRELLINVWKHADVDSAQLHMRVDSFNDTLEIRVIDHGSGFDVKELQKPSAKLSFGLYSIRERMHLLGGKVEIESNRGFGTTVRISVPVRSFDLLAGAAA